MSELPALWTAVASRLRRLYATDEKPLPWAIIDRLEALAEAEDTKPARDGAGRQSDHETSRAKS